MISKIVISLIGLASLSSYADVVPNDVNTMLFVTECSTQSSVSTQWWRTLKGSVDGENYFITDLSWNQSVYGQDYPQPTELTSYELDGFKYSKGQVLWRDPAKVEVEREDGSKVYLTNFTYSICRTPI